MLKEALKNKSFLYISTKHKELIKHAKVQLRVRKAEYFLE